MSLRPASARWFELLTARDSLTITVEALARTGSVELETHSETHARINLPDLQERMAEYNRLARRYHTYLSLIHISEPTRLNSTSRMPSSA